MKKIFTVVASWAVLMAACASFTSCEDDDDDNKPKKENSDVKPSDDESSKSAQQKTIEAAVANCTKLGDVYEVGKTQLFAYLSNDLAPLMSVEFENGEAVSISYYVDCKTEALAKKAIEAGKDDLSKYETASTVGQYVVVVSTDPEDLEDYKGLTFDEIAEDFKDLAYDGPDEDEDDDDSEDDDE